MGINEIRVATEDDQLLFKDGEIHALVNKSKYVYRLDSVKKLTIITKNMGQGSVDRWMFVEVGDDAAIYIGTGHRCFQPFLNEQIGKVLPLERQKIIDALSCTDDNLFEIYNYMQKPNAIDKRDSDYFCKVSFVIWGLAHLVGSYSYWWARGESRFVSFVAGGMFIIGYVFEIVALIKNPKSKIAGILLVIYIFEIVALVIIWIILVTICTLMMREFFNSCCGHCSF